MLKRKLAQFSPVLDRRELETGPAKKDGTWALGRLGRAQEEDEATQHVYKKAAVFL